MGHVESKKAYPELDRFTVKEGDKENPLLPYGLDPTDEPSIRYDGDSGTKLSRDDGRIDYIETRRSTINFQVDGNPEPSDA